MSMAQETENELNIHHLDAGLASKTLRDSDAISQIEKQENDMKQFENSRDIDQVTAFEETASGGFWAWTTLIGGMIIQFCSFGYTNAFGVYQDFYVREFLTTSTASQISWIGSTQVFLVSSVGLFSGRLFDKGYFYHLLWTGCFLIVFSIFMLSLAKPNHYYQVFLSQGVGLGLGGGLTYIPSVAVLAQHFPEPHRRALFMMVVASGSSLGSIVHPIMLNNLLHGSVGFANGVRASAGLLGGMLLVAVCLMRPKYNRVVGQTESLITLNASMKKFSRDSAYIIAIIGMTLVMCGIYFPLFYIQLDAIRHDLNPTFAFYTLAILNVPSTLGRIIPGLCAGRLGVTNMTLFVGLGCGILNFAMLGVTSIAGFTVFAALYGFFSGAYFALVAPMSALFADHPNEIGSRIGISFAVLGVGSLVGTPVGGALLTGDFLWWRPLTFSGVVCLGGTVVFLATRLALGRKQRGWTWVL